jgi:protein O-GlcNAc transferase
MGRYDEADADFRRVLRLDPWNAAAEVELGLLAWHRGLGAEAVGHFRWALERTPDDARIHAYLADTLNQAGDFPGAYQALERALQLDPRHAKACHLMGRVLDRMGRPEEAREMYHRGRKLGGT